MVQRRCVDVCCVYNLRWRGASVRIITGKAQRYKLFCEVDGDRIWDAGIRLAEKWVGEVIEVERVCNTVVKLKLDLQNRITAIISACTPLVGLLDEQKDPFY